MRVTIALTLALAACGTPSGGTTRTDDILALTPDTTAGEQVYTANCAICHLADGTGSTNGGVGNDLTTTMPDTHAATVDYVINGKGDMTPFGDVLTDQEIADVVAYVYQLTGN